MGWVLFLLPNQPRQSTGGNMVKKKWRSYHHHHHQHQQDSSKPSITPADVA